MKSRACVSVPAKNSPGWSTALARRGYKGLIAAMQQPIESPSALARFGQIGRGYIQFAADNPGLYRVMFHPELARAPSPKDTHRQAAELTFAYVVTTISRAQRAGEVRPGDPVNLAAVAWSTVHGAGALLIDGHFDGPASEFADLVVKNMFAGFAPIRGARASASLLGPLVDALARLLAELAFRDHVAQQLRRVEVRALVEPPSPHSSAGG